MQNSKKSHIAESRIKRLNYVAFGTDPFQTPFTALQRHRWWTPHLQGMLKITPNIFEALDGKLDFVSRDGDASPAPPSCGIIIPDMDAVEFSNENSSLSHIQKWIELRCAASWFLFVIDSSWQTDTPRMRYVGLKPSLNNDNDWTTEIAASAVLAEPEGRIRHCGLVQLKPELYGKALGFIGKRPRTAFLVADFAGSLAPSKLLSVLHQESAQNVLHVKKAPFIDWIRLMIADGSSGLLFITSFGWAEKYCDFRYLVLGERTALATLLIPDSPSSTPCG